MNEDENQKKLEAYNAQIRQLEETIECIEKEVEHYRSHSLTTTTTATSTIIPSHFYGWKFRMHNGMISIDTGIKSISDLLPLSYLSPLSADWGLFDQKEECDIYLNDRSDLLLQFIQETNTSWISFFMSLLERPNQLNRRLLLPAPRSLISQALLDQLVTIFFQCHNMYKLCIHKPSFEAHYATLEDVLSDAITLSICCYVCTTPCNHLDTINPQEQRALADFLFNRCKSIILDQFDDYEKRFETVAAIVLLVQYMHFTLRFSDCRHLLDLAYNLCLDIQREMTDEQPTIKQALFKRHFYFIVYFRRIINSVANDSFFSESCHISLLDEIEDESEESKRWIRALNWSLRAFDHPFIIRVLKQVNLAYFGQVGVFSFESMVKLEIIIDEWLSIVPDDIRLCHDYHSQEACEAAIRQTTDDVKLFSFVDFCALHLWIYCFLLKPLPDQRMDEQMSRYVLQKSLEKSAKYSYLAVRAIHRMFEVALNEQRCDMSLVGCDSLLTTIDLLILTSSDNRHLAKDTRELIHSIYRMLNKFNYMYNICATYGPSPMESILSGTKQSMRFHMEYYDQLSHPWLSVVYDATCYISHFNACI
ncbi:hypothetical protein EDC96DRAFT_492876 [Choanephora cucurbitarum]|nr:hypothetical protein EDC96DRAFT_492876 [Choanephora cucurbitarum]